MIMSAINPIWKAIPGFNKYQVSNEGCVVHSATGRYKKATVLKRGYSYVRMMSDNGKLEPRYVHSLVAKAFVPNPLNYPQVNHIDAVKTNNLYTNLEWVTAAQNTAHAIKMGLRKFYPGVLNPRAKLNESQVLNIRALHKTSKLGYKKLAKMFNVSASLIRKIVLLQGWKHI